MEKELQLIIVVCLGIGVGCLTWAGLMAVFQWDAPLAFLAGCGGLALTGGTSLACTAIIDAIVKATKTAG